MNIGGQWYTVSGVQALPSEDPALRLTIDGVIPNGARATVSFLERPDAEPRPLAFGTTLPAPTTTAASPIGNADIYTGFTFTDSKGAPSTFGVIAHIRRPFWLSGLGSRNEVLIGPRLTLRTNSSDQDDENSILLSAPLGVPALLGPARGANRTETPLVHVITFDVGPTIEAEKDFGNKNLVTDGQFNIWFSTQGATGRRGVRSGYAVDVRPYFGFEAGRNLKNRI